MSVTGSAPAGAPETLGGPSIGLRPALDGLRAVAVTAVIAYHLDAPWMRGGYLGVDLFMVLSGFLITGLLLVEVERSGRVSLGRFWARRARRILPAVVLLVTVLAVYAAWFASPVERVSLRWDALASLTSWANWRFIVDGSGYWAQFSSPSPLTHMWSLAVEEQFYVVWPAVVAAVVGAAATRGARDRTGQRRLLVVATGGVAASAVAMALLYDPAFPSRAYLGTDTRVQTLLVGALGAILVRPGPGRPAFTSRRVGRLVPLAALLAAAFAVGADDRSSWMYRGGSTVFALVALVVVLAAADGRGRLAAVLGTSVLVAIGRRSFGWYLWHWPAIVLLTPDRLGVDGASRTVVVLVVTVAAAELSFRAVERPLRTAAFDAPGRRIAVVAVAGVAVVAALVVAATTVRNPERPDLRLADLALPDTAPVAPAVEPAAESAEPAAAPAASAERPDVAPPPARGVEASADAIAPGSGFVGPEHIVVPEVSDPTDGLVGAAVGPAPSERPIDRVLLQGDSVAIFSALPLAEALAAAGVQLDDRTFPGQSIANPDVLHAVEHAGADLSVWYVSVWDTGDPDDIRTHHARFVDASLAVGADVVFVDRPPIAPELETDERQWSRVFAADLARQHPGRVHFLDASAVWGGDFVVDADGDGLPERMLDGVHVCPQGSARWTAWFLDELHQRYLAVAPADPATWLDGAWLDDPHWAANVGQCDPT